MKLTLNDIKKITVGAVRIWEEEGAFCFSSMTEKQLAAFARCGESIAKNAAATTGVRLDFHTDSHEVRYAATKSGRLEALVDGMLVLTRGEAGEEKVLPLPGDGKWHRVTLVLPSHGAPGGLLFVALDDGAGIERHKFDTKMLFIGDSITQGHSSHFDTLSHAYLVSDHYNAESIIQAAGGGYFEVETLEKLDFAPDTVIVAYGTNDAARFTPEEEEERSLAFFQRVCEFYKGAEIFAVTPRFCVGRDVEEAYPVSKMAAPITRSAQKCGITVLDGMKMFPRNDDLMLDSVHPNELGFSLYAHNLIKALEAHKK